jgi:hypothetical protein
MRKTSRFALFTLVLAVQLTACDSVTGSSLNVEKMPEITPDLPPVPQLPPPPYPITYEDGSHSVYGARQKARNANGEEIEVTGYIVKVYQPPACDEGEACPRPAAPHNFIGDSMDAPERDRMLVVGYAKNQTEIDDAVRGGEKGAQRVRSQGIVPVPRDFDNGNRAKIKGNLGVMSNQGFSSSNGLLEYIDHETLEIAQ